MVKKNHALSKTIVALDNMDKNEVWRFLKLTKNKISFVKVGMELFYQYGSKLVEEIFSEFGVNIFLDLKLHDIPNTVSKAIESLQGLPIEFLTVHLSGGQEMLSQAEAARAKYLNNCKLVGVSHLTSLDQSDFRELWNFNPDDVHVSFERLTRLCLRTKIGGMVFSVHELPVVKNIFNDFCRQSVVEEEVKLIKICPGIRFEDEIIMQKTQDQKRVAGPKQAMELGADYIVIGRSLTQSNKLEQRLEELTNY